MQIFEKKQVKALRRSAQFKYVFYHHGSYKAPRIYARRSSFVIVEVVEVVYLYAVPKESNVLSLQTDHLCPNSLKRGLKIDLFQPRSIREGFFCCILFKGPYHETAKIPSSIYH